jgi:tetratricopeptide (TPR) repeat protein
VQVVENVNHPTKVTSYIFIFGSKRPTFYDGRILSFDRHIEINPRDDSQWVSRGRLSKAECKYAEAVEDYTKAIEIAIEPTDADVYCYCGDAHVGMGEYDRALVDYEKALRLNPRHAMSFIGRGDLYKKLGDVRKAMKEYENCLEIVDANHFDGKKRLEECHPFPLEGE